MSIPSDLKYTAEHEWIRLDNNNNRAIVGITSFAQEQLGDVVYVELPSPGDQLKANASFGVVESVKAVSDLYSPLTAEVLEVNDRLEDEPELVNDDPYGDGWMIVLNLDGAQGVDELLDAKAYEQLIEEE